MPESGERGPGMGRAGLALAFRELAESLPQLVWTRTRDGTTEYVNSQWNLYAFGSGPIPAVSAWSDHVHPEDLAQLTERMAVGSASGVRYDVSFRIRRHDGVYRRFDTRVTPLHDADGSVGGWACVATDVHAAGAGPSNRARAAEQLARAEAVAGVGSWSFDLTTGEVQWSEQLFRITGVEGRVAPDYAKQASIYAPASWAALSRAVEYSIASGEGYELELELIRPDGERRWTSARAQTRRGEDGKVTELVGTLQDVTELTQARHARDRALERMRLATSATKVGIWDWDVGANVMVWDDTMYTLYGVSPESREGTYALWRRGLHPDDAAAAESAVRLALDGERFFDTAFRVCHPDGQTRYIRGIGTVQRDASGVATRMIGVNWDETALKTAERALRSSEALLREFVRHAPAAIAMLDRDLRYLQTSERWATDYHVVGQDLIGRRHYDVFPDVPERWKEVHQRALLGAVERCDEDPFPRADGTMEWLLWEVRPWHLEDGAVGGVVFFTQVITARKEIELRLVQKQRALERSNRDLEHFAYVASHDLQEPLRAVSGCAQILERRYEKELDAAAHELLKHIVDGAARLRALIEDLLAYSRVNTHDVTLEQVDTRAAVQRALGNLSVAIDESNATCEVGPMPIVRADASQLVTLFQNLIGNAIKYRGDRKPTIRIDCETRDGEVEFFVRDNGIGIDAAHFERIFTLFQRLHTRAEYPGTGIGLAICKAIVERHEGTISVASREGVGSTFAFTLAAKGAS